MIVLIIGGASVAVLVLAAKWYLKWGAARKVQSAIDDTAVDKKVKDLNKVLKTKQNELEED